MMTPHSVRRAEDLRNIADRVERGEIVAIAICGVLAENEGVFTFYREGEDGKGYLDLVGASQVLASRVLHGYGVPEARDSYHPPE